MLGCDKIGKLIFLGNRTKLRFRKEDKTISLVEIIAALFLQVFTPHLLFMIARSSFKRTCIFANIFAFRIVSEVLLFACPIINTVCGGTIYRIYYGKKI